MVQRDDAPQVALTMSISLVARLLQLSQRWNWADAGFTPIKLRYDGHQVKDKGANGRNISKRVSTCRKGAAGADRVTCKKGAKNKKMT